MKIYSVNHDLWLLGLLTGAAFVGLGQGFELIGDQPLAGTALLLLVLLEIGWVLALGVPCEYYLEDDCLRIRAGLRFWSIPYDDIQQVEASAPLWPHLGWSLRRVTLVHGSRTTQISPQQREEFVSDLQRRINQQQEVTLG